MRKPKLLDLNDAVQHPGRHVVVDLAANLEEEEDLDLLDPVSVTLDAVSTGNLLLVSGDAEAHMVMECSRCLSPVKLTIPFHIEEEFPVEGVPSGYGNREYAEVKEVDEAFPLFDGNSLRYEDLIRQSLWLNLPLRPLCRDDCPGLPEAQQDEEHARPEFGALGKLLDDDEEHAS
ncbi:MAG TPA: YceD family protein [Fimbriimonadales bacterium]|jgi:uncharacterized protein|nr:YceD family protein [Fimbriimonadales bacterium]